MEILVWTWEYCAELCENMHRSTQSPLNHRRATWKYMPLVRRAILEYTKILGDLQIQRRTGWKYMEILWRHVNTTQSHVKARMNQCRAFQIHHRATWNTRKYWAEPVENTWKYSWGTCFHVALRGICMASKRSRDSWVVFARVFTWLCEVFAWLPKGLETPERYLHVFSRGYV